MVQVEVQEELLWWLLVVIGFIASAYLGGWQ
jgi:hypothetical protein